MRQNLQVKYVVKAYVTIKIMYVKLRSSRAAAGYRGPKQQQRPGGAQWGNIQIRDYFKECLSMISLP